MYITKSFKMLLRITPEIQAITNITLLRIPVLLYAAPCLLHTLPPIDKEYNFYTISTWNLNTTRPRARPTK